MYAPTMGSTNGVIYSDRDRADCRNHADIYDKSHVTSKDPWANMTDSTMARLNHDLQAYGMGNSFIMFNTRKGLFPSATRGFQ